MNRIVASLFPFCAGIAAIAAPTWADILYESDHGTIGKVTAGGVSSAFASSTNLKGLAFDSAGNLYAANYGDSTIEKFTPGGVGSIFSSTGLSLPHGLAFDTAGNLYAANQGDNTITRFTPGGVGSVFASTGSSEPTGLAFDSAGNLYASFNNNTIQRFAPDGIGTLFATITTVDDPSGLAFDRAGNLYVANSSPLFNLILKISPAGVVSTFAAGVPSEGLAFDSAGNLYASDWLDGTIVKYPPTGGGVGPVYASNGVLNSPTGLAFTDDAGVPLPLANEVPEPASSLTLLLGAFLLHRRCCRLR